MIKDKDLKSEIDEIKKEIIEINKNIKNILKQKENVGIDFDFTEYKKVVNQEDVDKLLNFKKYKWVWFIPIIGYYWWSADLSINIESIDRGLVRSTWVAVNWHYFIIVFLVHIISIFINILPFFQIFFIKKKTIKKLNKMIEEKND